MDIGALARQALALAGNVGNMLGAATPIPNIVAIAKTALDFVDQVRAVAHTTDHGQLDTARTALEAHIAEHEKRTFASLDEAAKR